MKDRDFIIIALSMVFLLGQKSNRRGNYGFRTIFEH